MPDVTPRAAPRPHGAPYGGPGPKPGPGPSRHASRTRRRRRDGFGSPGPAELVLRYALLVLVLLLLISPFLWQLSTSLKSLHEDIYTETPSFLPKQPTLDNYAQVAETIPVWSYAVNSLVVAAIVVLGNAAGATLAGYALARLRFRGAKLLLVGFLATLVLPGEVTIISQYITVRGLGLADTLLGVALPGAIGMLNVLLMRTAFQAIPQEMDEAAVIDGATPWQRLVHIGLPNVRGMLSVITIFAFIGAWDDFLWPLIVLNDPENFTLTVGLQYLNGTFTNNPRLPAAGTMISFIPIVILFASLQRFFFRGVEEGAIKG
ncbi:carbohydrate ABC transporter permease [Streptosporangium sandarakinum]|uniref:carbohydrate ABC transporter permease n=1 Tax=Streptosporangium TaxID=2000 RepID=UPI0031F80AB2